MRRRCRLQRFRTSSLRPGSGATIVSRGRCSPPTVGLAYVSGMVRRTTISTGVSVDLPFFGNDMRFMDGVYRGVDGRVRQGTFALI